MNKCTRLEIIPICQPFIWRSHDLLGESANGFFYLSYSEDAGSDKHASLTQYSFPNRNELIKAVLRNESVVLFVSTNLNLICCITQQSVITLYTFYVMHVAFITERDPRDRRTKLGRSLIYFLLVLGYKNANACFRGM